MQFVIGNVVGAQGQAGERGQDGATGDKGKSYNPRGEWVANTQYSNTASEVDVVTYMGGAYYCIQSHSSPTPPNIDTTNWGLLCSGLTRNVCLFTLDYDKWIEDNTIAPYTHKQSITYPANTFTVDDILNVDINGAIQRKYSVVLANRIGTNGVMFYATIDGDISEMINIYGSIYFDRLGIETIYQV